MTRLPAYVNPAVALSQCCSRWHGQHSFNLVRPPLPLQQLQLRRIGPHRKTAVSGAKS